LPTVYNHAIEAALVQPAILFSYTTTFICAIFFWPERVREAVERFDVVGVAGTRPAKDKTAGWVFADEKFTRETPEN
jgi:hypothetical protein